MPIETAELDGLRQAYKAAVDLWVAAIREEEALATADYSLPAWERWDQAGFNEQDAQDKAKAAKEAYKDGLRQRDYGF
jgi:flagellar biosynthesis/type III secretory pathway protein FliH